MIDMQFETGDAPYLRIGDPVEVRIQGSSVEPLVRHGLRVPNETFLDDFQQSGGAEGSNYALASLNPQLLPGEGSLTGYWAELDGVNQRIPLQFLAASGDLAVMIETRRREQPMPNSDQGSRYFAWPTRKGMMYCGMPPELFAES